VKYRIATILVASFVLVSIAAAGARLLIPNLHPFPDRTGAIATFNMHGDIDEQNVFFQSLGTNGRSCATCHQPDQAMSLSRNGVQELYSQTLGRDPLFAAIDGANCPTDDERKRSSHSLLLERGLIRVGLPLPANPQFSIAVVHDPYGCAITFSLTTGQQIISVYRRPLPSTNLRFLSTIMFDGRFTSQPLNNASSFMDNLKADLTAQAIDAIQTHSQAIALPDKEKLDAIVNFELGLSTAQIRSDEVGFLDKDRAEGGPLALSSQAYHPGINDALGGDPSGASFNPSAFTLYSAWDQNERNDRHFASDREKMRAKIAAGEKLFNTATAIITDVRGLNDNPALGRPKEIKGTCTTCHDAPNVGNHSVALPLDIGTSRQVGYETNPHLLAGLQSLSAPDLPIYEIRGCPDDQNPANPGVFYTSDPGKALITGQCSDLNRGKGPILRGLAARAPYFHNGAAANLNQLVDFYNERFQMNLTNKEKEELIAFLNSL
jgi:cytochrome c peroxidase